MSIWQQFTVTITLLGRFWQQSVHAKIFRWNLILILAQFVLILIKFNDMPLMIPLYFSLPWGESVLSSASTLFFLPLFSIAIVLINSLIAAFLHLTSKLLTNLLISFSLIFSLLNLIALINIIALAL